jgi:hypothetical protein
MGAQGVRQLNVHVHGRVLSMRCIASDVWCSVPIATRRFCAIPRQKCPVNASPGALVHLSLALLHCSDQRDRARMATLALVCVALLAARVQVSSALASTMCSFGIL